MCAVTLVFVARSVKTDYYKSNTPCSLKNSKGKVTKKSSLAPSFGLSVVNILGHLGGSVDYHLTLGFHSGHDLTALWV